MVCEHPLAYLSGQVRDMEKRTLHSPDLTARNIEKIAELFPSVITESRDAEGNVTTAIDFDLLRQELSDHVVEGPQERYQLDWPGKRAAVYAANAPIAKTLRPCYDKSVNFDYAENIFISGDNLDTLKLLQESYLGKIKFIYIDPPYNTGDDLVYRDDFAESHTDYLVRSSQLSATGERMVTNPDSSGRFHSDWLSMMLPRLKCARNLLTDDGVIAISIDDREIATLRLLCAEIFGPKSTLGTLVWRRRPTSDSRNYSRVSPDHEYVLLYGRGPESRFVGRSIDETKYANPDNDARGPWTSENLTGLADATRRPNLHYDLVDPATGIAYPPPPGRGWSKSRSSMKTLIDEGRILWPSSRDGRPREKKFLSELRSHFTGFSTWLPPEEIGYTYTATREVRDILGGKVFDFPKPMALIKILILQNTGGDDLVLDFFAGSGTTAHAVVAANQEDGGDRRFIAVQVEEPTGEDTTAGMAGYGTVDEISLERIRRSVVVAAPKDSPIAGDRQYEPPESFGFRSLFVDTSNTISRLKVPDDLSQAELFSTLSTIKADRDPEDLLFQVLLDYGLELTLRIEKQDVEGAEIFSVDDGAVIACFADTITPVIIGVVARQQPLRAVFRDDAFESDAAKINAEQIFKEISPITEVRTI